MSTVAWMRVVDWKLSNCTAPPMSEAPPSEYDVTHRDAYWWRYTRLAAYERQNSTSAVYPSHVGQGRAAVERRRVAVDALPVHG
jgi:hypothetical protein